MANDLLELIKNRASYPKTIHDMTDGFEDGSFEIEKVADKQEITYIEEEYDFKFPKLLKEIYTKIGNGGFGPGYGLMPVDEIISYYDEFCEEFGEKWNKYMLPILTWGCTMYECIDISKPEYPVYFVDTENEHCIDDSEFSFSDATENEFDNTGNIEFKKHKDTFEKLMTDWVNGINLWNEISSDNIQ